MTIEEQVAKAILEESDTISIGGHEFKREQPSVATLIKVSALISTLPGYNENGIVFTEVLSKAKDMKVVGDIAAYMILGVKRMNERRTVTICEETNTERFVWSKMRKVKQTEKKTREIEEGELLSKLLLENITIAQLNTIVVELLKGMQINDFFTLTASLSGVMITKRTKEAETQSGD